MFIKKFLSLSVCSVICDWLTTIITFIFSLSIFDNLKGTLSITISQNNSGHKMPKNAHFYFDQLQIAHIQGNDGKYHILSYFGKSSLKVIHPTWKLILSIVVGMLLIGTLMWKIYITKKIEKASTTEEMPHKIRTKNVTIHRNNTRKSKNFIIIKKSFERKKRSTKFG